MLVNVRQYLTPNAQDPVVVAVVEYYNASLDHFFVTSYAERDRGCSTAARWSGWERTGFRFLAYTRAGGRTQPGVPLLRHAGRRQLALLLGESGRSARRSRRSSAAVWVLETSTAFYIAGAEPRERRLPGRARRPVYRFFNPSELNHRFTAEQTVATDLSTTVGWIAEGYGPGPLLPSMCSPLGS